MTPGAGHHVVELRSDRRPVGQYLHAWEDEVTGETGTLWSRDPSRALRFPDRRAAEHHIHEELDVDAVASPLEAAEDAARPDCGCTDGMICRRNGNCPRRRSPAH